MCNCPTCYSNLKDCKSILDGDSPMRNRAMAAMDKAGMDFNDSVTISHVAEAYLANLDRFRAKAKYSLRGLRAVTHHGCHYSKIYYREVASGNFERPTVLDKVLEGFGAKVVDYPERSLCCGLGFHHIMLYPDYTRAVTRRKYSGIVEADPDLLVTMCAGCTLSLDMCQEKILSELGVDKEIPVMNISELIALLLGADPYNVAGIDLHGVPIEPLLRKIGIPGRGNELSHDRLRLPMWRQHLRGRGPGAGEGQAAQEGVAHFKIPLPLLRGRAGADQESSARGAWTGWSSPPAPRRCTSIPSAPASRSGPESVHAGLRQHPGAMRLGGQRRPRNELSTWSAPPSTTCSTPAPWRATGSRR